jgi:hypothetical protein
MFSGALVLWSASFFTKQRVIRFLGYLVKRCVKVEAFAVEVKFNIDVGALVHLDELLNFELHKIFVLTFVLLKTKGLVGGDLLHDVLLLELRDLLLHQLLALGNAVHVLIEFLL